MQVRKRNGSIVNYDREFIVRAVTLAAAAAGEHGDEAVQRAGKAAHPLLPFILQRV